MKGKFSGSSTERGGPSSTVKTLLRQNVMTCVRGALASCREGRQAGTFHPCNLAVHGRGGANTLT